MQYEEINEKTIKISLTFQDLVDHDVKLSDFFTNQSMVENLFYELVEELGLEERFSSGLLTFQIQPFPKGVNIIVTEENIDIDPNNLPDDPEEFEQLMTDFFGRVEDLKQNGGTMADTSTTETKETKVENKPDPDFVFYSLEFENMSQLLTAVKNVKIDAEESELYSYEDKFYLIILDNQKSKGKTAVSSMRARMLEYGQETVNSRETLQEYGEILINTRALEVLSKI